MTQISVRSVNPVALLIASVLSTPLIADTPTIGKLVGGVPILTPQDAQLQRFSFRLESPLPFEVPLVATFSWSRPDKYRMIVAAGEERTPFWFLAEKKSMMFDVSTGTAHLAENAGPKFIVRAGADKFTIQYSLTSQKNAEVLIDLPSLLSGAAENGELATDPVGDWLLTTVSESGKSKTIAVFKNTETFPIRHLEMRSTKDDSLAFAIRDIAINGEADSAFPNFPASESFPKDLQLIGPGDRKVEEARDGFEVVAHGLRTLAAQGRYGIQSGDNFRTWSMSTGFVLKRRMMLSVHRSDNCSTRELPSHEASLSQSPRYNTEDPNAAFGRNH